MASPYDKILQRSAEKEAIKNKSSTKKPHLHMISFDDSDDSSRVDVPNIFLDDR